MFEEKKLSSRTVFEGRVFDVTVDTVELENGNTSTREVIHHNGGAAILAFNEAGQLAMVRQYRYAAGREMLEIPAGKVEVGEEPRATALRELSEEVGCEAEEMRAFGSVLPTCAYDTEIIYLFIARKLRPVGQHLDADEFLGVEWMELDAVVEMALSGSIIDSKTIAGILRYQMLKNKGEI